MTVLSRMARKIRNLWGVVTNTPMWFFSDYPLAMKKKSTECIHSHIRYTIGKSALKSNLNLCLMMGTFLQNDDDTNDTFADPVVRVEALSTAGQAVALAQSPGLDASCAVWAHGSRAAGTWIMTSWGREWEGHHGTQVTREPTSRLGSLCARKPLLCHSQSPLAVTPHQGERSFRKWSYTQNCLQWHFTHLLSMFYYLLAILCLVFLLRGLYTLLLIFIAIMRFCRWENWGLGKLKNLPKSTEKMSSSAGI